MTPRFPVLLRLFARFVPADLRDPIAGDLYEEYVAIGQRSGPVRAAAWLSWQAVRLAVTFRWARAAHGRGLPPIGDELRRRMRVWDSLRQDITFGARMLRRQPGFTTVAVIALALGIGANTAMFSIVDTVLWRPLPYPAPHTVLSIGEQRPRDNRFHGPVAPADFYDWRRDNRTFTAIAAVEPGPVNISGDKEPERLRGIAVTAGFLDVIGIKPAPGRDFTRDDETEGRHRVVLLADGFWRRRFGADPSIVGRKLTLNENPYEVVGVMPPAFWWSTRGTDSETDVLLPYSTSGEPSRALHSMDVVGRLKPGVSFEQAAADLDAIGKRLSEQYPQTNAAHFPHVTMLQQTIVGDVRPALLVLLGAVGIVLAIACANVATLLLAKATGRQREIAVRLAIGAGRGRLIRQLLTESIMLALLGGGAGLLVAAWGLNVFHALVPASFLALPGIAHIGLDTRVLTIAVAMSAATGVIFGIVPALTASDLHLSSTLHEEGRSSSGGARTSRVRACLVVAELALSLVLLVGAALLLVSFKRVLDVAPGFDPQHLVVAAIARSEPVAPSLRFYQTLLERVRRLPNVESAALGTPLPFVGVDGRSGFRIEGRIAESPIPVRARPRLVSAEYFSTLRIPLVRGRVFTDRDVEVAPPVVIINAAAARRYWPDEDPIGRRIDISFAPEPRWMEIVGVVGDVKHAGLDVDTDPEAYIPFRQAPFGGLPQRLSVVVRTPARVSAIAPLIKAAVADIDRNQPVGAVSAMEDLISASVASRRLNLWLVAMFGVIALVLTAAGLYGVMSYLVAQRTREIGVRMALGATPSTVLRLVLRQAGTLVTTGIAIGVVGALAFTRSLTTLLFGVTSTDPAVYGGVAFLLALVALVAILIPSSRATRVDPLTALR